MEDLIRLVVQHIKNEMCEKSIDEIKENDIIEHFSNTILKTSAQWQKEIGVDIPKYLGWDKSNFKYSFYQEKISLNEFNRRLREDK
jgi:hypothetical protein